jgi:hypothetical protein
MELVKVHSAHRPNHSIVIRTHQVEIVETPAVEQLELGV